MSPFAQAAFRTKDGIVYPSGPFHNQDVLPMGQELDSEGFLGHDNTYYTRDEATKILGANNPIQSEHLSFANSEQMQKSEFGRRVKSWMVKRKIYRAKPLKKAEGVGKVPPNFTPGLQSAETYLKSFDDRPEFAAARTLSGHNAQLDSLRDALGLYDDPYHQALHAHGLEPHEENVAKLKALVGADINELVKSMPNVQQPDAQQTQLPSADGSHYQIAGTEVDGLQVREDIPNMASIGATFNKYKVHPKVREVPMSDFKHPSVHDQFYNARDHERVANLVNQIHESGELNPLIVAYDKEGPYILEGAHRLAALHAMGKKSVPALVVHDRTDDLEKSYKDQVPGGKADTRKPEDFDQEQLGIGTKHEMEHTQDASLAQEIAMDHLVEDPNYYKKIKLIEKSELRKNIPDSEKPEAPKPSDHPVSRKSDLVVFHNLTADNLKHADELGGIAAPSLGVAHRDHPIDAFGDITLIAHPDMIDPKNGVPVFDADIYSPRHPRATYKIDDKKFNALKQELKPHAEHTGAYLDDMYDKLESGDVKPGGHYNAAWPALAHAFLATKGIKMPVPMKDRNVRFGEIVSQPAMQAFKAKYGKDWKPGQDRWLHREILTDPVHKELTEAVKIAAKQADVQLAHATHGNPDMENVHSEALANHLVDPTADENQGLLNTSTARMMLDSLVDYGSQEPDTYAYRDALKAEVDKHPDFADWFDAKVKSTHAGQYISQGFTASGNRRRIPYTLNNVLKLMTKKTRGGENFNYGVGTVRSQGAHKFNSLDEIRAHGHSLVDSETMKQVKERNDNEFGKIADDIRRYHNDPGGFRVLDALSSAMGEAQKRGRSLRAELTKDGFNNVPDNVLSRIQTFLKELKNSPTEYFEAKMQRAVPVREFKGAAVPATTDPALVASLKQRGLHVETYDKDKPESRSEAVKKIVDTQKLHLSERELLDTLRKSDVSWFAKGELQIPGLMPQDIQPANAEAEHTAQAVSEACKDGLCYDIVLSGRHSLGAKIALDEQTHTFWLLKPGSGNQSRAVGLHETVGTQAEREVCFSSIATNVFDVHNYPKAALLNIDNTQIATVAMASPLYIAAQDLGAVKCREALQEYLETGDIHKFALIDYVMGNTDSHGYNMLIEPDEKKVLLIDHGGAFAGRSFAPGHDPYTFIPFYLRLWNPLNYQEATPEERASAIPAPQPGLDAQLAHWLRGISPEKVAATLESYGIDDGGAAVSRLVTLQESETPGADVVKYWSGYNLS